MGVFNARTCDSANMHSRSSNVLQNFTTPKSGSESHLVGGNHNLSTLHRLTTKSTPSLRTPRSRISISTAIRGDDSSRMIPIVMPSPSSPSTFKFSLALALSIRRRRATSLRGPPLSFNAQTVLTPLGRCQEAHWDGLVSSDLVRRMRILPSEASPDLLDDPSYNPIQHQHFRPRASSSQLALRIPPIDQLPPLTLPPLNKSSAQPPVARPNDIDAIIKCYRSSPSSLFQTTEAPCLPTSIENLSRAQLKHYIKLFHDYAEYLGHLICANQVKFANVIGSIRAQRDSYLAEMCDLQTELYDVRGIASTEVEKLPSTSAHDIGVTSGLGHRVGGFPLNHRPFGSSTGRLPADNRL